jgi:hypothetical protein
MNGSATGKPAAGGRKPVLTSAGTPRCPLCRP